MTTLPDLVTADDVHLKARRRDAHDARRGAAVLVHGFGATGDEARVSALADALQDAGLDVLTYDARGHGRSGGEATSGDLERNDIAAAVDALAGDDERVIIIGASLGAIAALGYATAHPERVTGIVTVSCPARWRLPLNSRGILSALLTQTPLGRYFARRWMNVRIARGFSRGEPPLQLVTKLAAPLAIVHGRQDPFIAPTDAQLLYDAAKEPKRLALVDAMAHAYEPQCKRQVLDSVDWILSLSTS